MQKRRISALIAATAVLAFISYELLAHLAPNTAELPEIIQLLPESSSLLAYANVSDLRKAPAIEHLAAMALPTHVDADYADFINATGFDYRRDLDQVAITAIGEDRVAIADGRFDQDKIGAYALRSGSIGHRGGRTVYVIKGIPPRHDVFLTFLSKHRIAIATGTDVSSYLQRPHQPLDENLRQRLLRVAGSPLFVDWQIPTAERERRTATSLGIPALDSLHSIDLAIRPEGEQILISVEGECANPAQAQQLSATLEFLRSALPAGLTNPSVRARISPENATLMSHLLQTALINNDADRVRLIVAVTSDVLAGFFDKR